MAKILELHSTNTILTDLGYTSTICSQGNLAYTSYSSSSSSMISPSVGWEAAGICFAASSMGLGDAKHSQTRFAEVSSSLSGSSK